MFKKYIILISSVALLSTSHVVHAQTADSPTVTPATRQLFKNSIEANKEARSELRDQMKAKVQEFKAQIQTIKDTRKKMVVERIDARIVNANTRLTTKMGISLTRMTEFVATLKTRALALKTEGKDTVALDAAIISAESAIQTAITAVETQKTKTYATTITDELYLKSYVGQMVSGFRLDIQAVHRLVVAARQAVVLAHPEAARLRGVPNTATNSATIN